MRPGALGATDRALLAYDLAVLGLVLTTAPTPLRWMVAAAHLLVIPVVVGLARLDRGPEATPARHFLHLWVPLALCLGFYGEAGALRHLLVPGDLDAWVTAAERLLFPGSLYAAGPARLSVPVLELLHAVYFGYYLILTLPAMLAPRRARARVEEYLFVVIVCFLVHYAASYVFPVSGPTPLRARLLPDGVVFIPLMNLLYAGFYYGGMAFPSTHLAAAVIAAAYGGRFHPRLAWLFWAEVVGIGVATVACGFHYAVDVVAGALTGLLMLGVGRWLWRRRHAFGAAPAYPPSSPP